MSYMQLQARFPHVQIFSNHQGSSVWKSVIEIIFPDYNIQAEEIDLMDYGIKMKRTYVVLFYIGKRLPDTDQIKTLVDEAMERKRKNA